MEKQSYSVLDNHINLSQSHTIFFFFSWRDLLTLIDLSVGEPLEAPGSLRFGYKNLPLVCKDRMVVDFIFFLITEEEKWKQASISPTIREVTVAPQYSLPLGQVTCCCNISFSLCSPFQFRCLSSTDEVGWVDANSDSEAEISTQFSSYHEHIIHQS